MTPRQYQVAAFASRVFEGNPAAALRGDRVQMAGRAVLFVVAEIRVF